ncbi:MAG: alpha/beta fold hydrolase [Actinomycetota bacterium]|nr:alpha/beta fold hydrolase [Actinomycetota bacterium]
MTTRIGTGTVEANGVQITYESFGEPDRPTVLLVMGFGTQMIAWPDGLCADIADRGYRVVRFDNRDVGLSTHLHDAPQPDLMAIMGGDPRSAPYLLDDMAADTVGLLDALGVDSAHVVGASMGGMIAQVLAIRHPERVCSLVSVMSTPGPSAGAGRPEAMQAILTPAPPELEAYVERAVAVYRVIGSPGYPMDKPALRARAAESFRRSYDPAGVLRQAAAVLASPDRSEALQSLAVPTHVIHGREDPLVTLSGGERTAELVPGATLDVMDGMGHDFPRALWSRFVDGIVANAQRAAAT